MPSIEIRKNRLNYETKGQGFPLLFVHGLGGDLRNWTYQFNEFAKKYRVFALDLRGHGSSEAPATGYSIDAFTEDVADFIKIMGLWKVYFVGLSMGGMIGQNIAAAHPELIQALVLADTSSKPGKLIDGALDPAGKIMETSAKIAEEKGREPLADVTLKLMFSDEFLEKEPKLAAQVREYIVNGPTKGYVGAIRNIFLSALDLGPLLPTIKAPTLIVCGTKDKLTPLPESERIKAGIAGSELKTIEGAGHVGIIEKHAEFNAILAAFLKKMDAKRYEKPRFVRAFN